MCMIYKKWINEIEFIVEYQPPTKTKYQLFPLVMNSNIEKPPLYSGSSFITEKSKVHKLKLYTNLTSKDN